MSLSYSSLSADEFLARAKEVYRHIIGPEAEAENYDRIVVFDLKSEDYEIGDDESFVQIVRALKARRPDAEVTGFRIGDGGRTIDRFGSPRLARST
jgi:hypothetical protein